MQQTQRSAKPSGIRTLSHPPANAFSAPLAWPVVRVWQRRHSGSGPSCQRMSERGCRQLVRIDGCSRAWASEPKQTTAPIARAEQTSREQRIILFLSPRQAAEASDKARQTPVRANSRPSAHLPGHAERGHWKTTPTGCGVPARPHSPTVRRRGIDIRASGGLGRARKSTVPRGTVAAQGRQGGR
jgi:hypothetical protein